MYWLIPIGMAFTLWTLVLTVMTISIGLLTSLGSLGYAGLLLLLNSWN